MGVTSAQPSVVSIESDLARASDVMATHLSTNIREQREPGHGSGRLLAALMCNAKEFTDAFDPLLPTFFVLEGLLEYLAFFFFFFLLPSFCFAAYLCFCCLPIFFFAAYPLLPTVFVLEGLLEYLAFFFLLPTCCLLFVLLPTFCFAAYPFFFLLPTLCSLRASWNTWHQILKSPQKKKSDSPATHQILKSPPSSDFIAKIVGR